MEKYTKPETACIRIRCDSGILASSRVGVATTEVKIDEHIAVDGGDAAFAEVNLFE